MLGSFCPTVRLDQACHVPQILGSQLRVFQTLLNLDALVLPYECSQNVCVSNGRIESLVTSSFVIVHILTDDFPVFELEGLFSQDLIGVGESVEDEPAEVSRCG